MTTHLILTAELTCNSGAIVSCSPDYVKTIEVVNRRGTLTQLRKLETTVVGEVHEKEKSGEVTVREPESAYHVMTNSQYVTNVSFNKKTSDGSSKLSTTSTTGDSLVTSSLLKFTSNKFEDEEKGQLSGYILDDNHGAERAKHRRTEEMFNSSVVDSNDELTNLYKTISRKQILSKVQSGNFGHHKLEQQQQSLRQQQQQHQAPPHARPLAKILNMLHSVNNTENMYTSIAEDSVYQSLPPQTSAEGKLNVN